MLCILTHSKWSRITFSRFTTSYFLLAILHCIIQIIFQAQAYALNNAAADRLWSFIQRGNMTQESNGFAVLANDLRICYQIPNTISTDSCEVIWSGTNQSGPSFGKDAASLAAPVHPVATSGADTSVSDIAEAVAVTSDPANVVTQASSSLSATSILASATSSTPPVLTSPSPSAPMVTVVVTRPYNAQKATGAVINGPNNDAHHYHEEKEVNGVGLRLRRCPPSKAS